MGKMKKFKCTICNVVFEGETAPHICPICNAGEDKFIEVKEEEKKFRNDTNEYFLIIGNGIAGLSAAKAIRERNKTCKITMISNENELTYYRPNISDKINEEIDKSFYVEDKSWYDNNNINTILNTKIESINEVDKTVKLESGFDLKYDKLILANGSKCFVPPIKGTNLENVFTLKNVEDLRNIKNALDNSKKVVVIGGGLLGLEAAWEFKLKGLDVVVIDNSKNVLSRQLDKDGSDILYKSIIEAGVKVKLECITESIEGNNQVERVNFNDGTSIECDMVVLSVGVRANTEIVKDTSIKTDRGILVDETMRTNVEDIYACGDVAQFENKSIAIWPVALKMGELAGQNACEDREVFEGESYPVYLDAMNTKVFSIGKISDFDKEVFKKDIEKKLYNKLFIKGNKLVGAILINDLSLSNEILKLIEDNSNLDEFINRNFKK